MKKTVIITGCNGSLGYELAKRLNNDQFSLILHSRKKSKKLINLRNRNSSIRLIYGDISNNNNLQRIAESINIKDFNILINNSGIYVNKPFKKVKEKEILNVFKSNFFSNIILLNKLVKQKIRSLRNEMEET